MGFLTIVSVLHVWIIITANIGTLATTSPNDMLDLLSFNGKLDELKKIAGDMCTDVNINYQSGRNQRTPLYAATLNNKKNVVLFLLSCNADPNIQTNFGRTPLMIGSKFADIDVINALLTTNADLDVQDNDRMTALMYAASYNNDPDVIKALIAAGSQLNIKCKHEKTALMYASRYNYNPDVAKNLITAGAEPNHIDYLGWTALRLAASFNIPDVTQALITGGADIDLQSREGWTALMSASAANNEGATRALLVAGADINIKNDVGNTAMDIAKTSGVNSMGLKYIIQIIEEFTDVNNGVDTNPAVILPHTLPVLLMCFRDAVDFLTIYMIAG